MLGDVFTAKRRYDDEQPLGAAFHGVLGWVGGADVFALAARQQVRLAINAVEFVVSARAIELVVPSVAPQSVLSTLAIQLVVASAASDGICEVVAAFGAAIDDVVALGCSSY